MRKTPKHLWHHAREFDHVKYGVVTQAYAHEKHDITCKEGVEDCNLGYDDDYHWELHMDGAYRWVEEKCGFWPLFLAVGDQKTAIWMTGYFQQWQRLIKVSRDGNEYRKAGEFPCQVLFSFDHEPPGAFYMDYDYFNIVLNSIDFSKDEHGKCHTSSKPKSYEERWILKNVWDSKRWIQKALSKAKDSTHVQAVVPELDLRLATRICCRNQKTKRDLIKMGFDPDIIEVLRVKISDV